jgi:hypothetical protein
MAHGGEDPLAAGADLAEFLMSDRPLGEVERLILAELVLGEIRRSPRKPRLHPNHPDVAPVVALLRQVEASGSKRDAAVQQTAKTFRITPRTVRDREKIVLERERAEAEAKVNRREAQE